MALKVEVSVGEFLDKMTILEIKSERIKGEDKLLNVNRELELLRTIWAESPLSAEDVGDLEDTRFDRLEQTLYEAVTHDPL